MVDKQLGGAGLRGQSAGDTALCTVGKSGTGLTYRGYDITDLAENATFEEVAYLIYFGELPNQQQLDEYKTTLRGYRKLPEELIGVLEAIPASAHPMDVMRTGCSMLGNLEPEGDFENQQRAADRLLGRFHRSLIIGTNTATTVTVLILIATRIPWQGIFLKRCLATLRQSFTSE